VQKSHWNLARFPQPTPLIPELIDELIESADAAELPERAEQWRQRKSEAEAAAEEVKRRDEAEKAPAR